MYYRFSVIDLRLLVVLDCLDLCGCCFLVVCGVVLLLIGSM